MPSVIYFNSKNIRRCIAISKDNLRINEEIRAKDIRLVSSANEQLGDCSRCVRLLRLAIEQQFDLVEVAPLAKPPVCRIMDYGKFRYEQQKREKEAKKNKRLLP